MANKEFVIYAGNVANPLASSVPYIVEGDSLAGAIALVTELYTKDTGKEPSLIDVYSETVIDD